MTLSRDDCHRELGLLPRWRLRGAVAPEPATAPLPPATPHLLQDEHTRGFLPHVKAEGATYFVTFRLADSLPADVLATWASLPEDQRSEKADSYLDQGAGECLLARPEAATILQRAVTYYADIRYTLHEYVLMPNHVHLLLTPLPGHTLSDILHSMKSWSAQKINALLGRVGMPLWQHERYDHLVRDDEEMQALRAYIRQNPVKAGLCAEESGFFWSSAWKEDAGKDAGATRTAALAVAEKFGQPHALLPADAGAAVGVAPASLPASLHTLDWDALRAAIQTCTRCDLHKTRTQAVTGVGDIHAEWLFIGEAPGADEDRQGEPFVGQAGKLLDAMLAALRLKRGENVYIANVLKSRPPGNRDPRPEEVAACLPYLERQIDLIRPKIIVALGRFAAQSLLLCDTPIGRLRGHVHEYRGVPLIVTYHPAYLLRNAADKAKAWEDLLLAANTLRDLQARMRT